MTFAVCYDAIIKKGEHDNNNAIVMKREQRSATMTMMCLRYAERIV